MAEAHVLIVDDEKSNLVFLRELFNMQEFKVSEAMDGATALRLAHELKPDLILLDVMMPGLDGFEVCRRLKAHEETRLIPVIMVTGLGNLNDKIKGLEVGADDFLSKPVNAAELITRSRSLLRIRELNQELEGAYHRLAEISTYTNDLLRGFDPYQFDAMASMRGLMEFLLGPGAGEKTQPKQVILLSGENGDQWSGWLYFQKNGQVKYMSLPRGVASQELEALFRGIDLVYHNQGDVIFGEIASAPLWSRLKVPSPQHNLVAYRSDQVAVVAMDFGKRVGTYDAQVLSALVGTIHLFLKTISSQIQEVERAFLYTINALARAAESHDEDTGNHLLRVNRYASTLARALGCEDEMVAALGNFAQMHDVGKLHIHPDILRKPGPLSPEEWQEVKKHTIYGLHILGDDPRLALAREVAISHHERWDGTGYPYGLSGEDIPLSGRITMMVDVYDALRSQRPYKPPFDHSSALKIITRGDDRVKPGYFDPRVLEAFCDLHQEMEAIYLEYKD